MINRELALRRHAAIRRLQEKLQASTDPYWQRVYEKALDLALNERRAISHRLYARLLNDAKRTIRRDKQDTPIITSFYILNKEGEYEVDDNVASEDPSAEQELDRQLRLDWIRRVLRRQHRSSLAIFHCMLDGLTVSETAQKLDMSESMVKKLRVEIKSIAEKILHF